eukprot:6130898-Prymnesium_polylepis.1
MVPLQPKRQIPGHLGLDHVLSRLSGARAHARGSTLGDAVSRERLRVVRVNATVARAPHAAVPLW